MAQTKGSSVTAPKGHATRARNAEVGGSFFGPVAQWLLVIVAIGAVLFGIMYFGRDVRSTVGGGHSGSPAPVVDTDVLPGL